MSHSMTRSQSTYFSVSLPMEDGITMMAELETPALEHLDLHPGDRLLACFATNAVRIVDE